jgi:hypothetical protein
MTKKQEMQAIIRRFREHSGKASVSMHEVAEWASRMGWPLPKPKSAIDRLAEMFSSAAREEYRTDDVTGHPYRVNMAVTQWQGKDQLTLWTDIDQAPRHIAHKSLFQRREQMIGDALHLTLDTMHWNRINPGEEPIQMLLDLTDDVSWRMNAPDEGEQKAA